MPIIKMQLFVLPKENSIVYFTQCVKHINVQFAFITIDNPCHYKLTEWYTYHKNEVQEIEHYIVGYKSER